MRPGRPVVPDTSFLVQLSEPGGRLTLELLEEALGRPRFVVPSCVLEELAALSRRLPGAALALEFARGMEVVEASGPPDEAVVELARELGGVVAAMDKGVLREARRRGLATLTLRKGVPVITGDPRGDPALAGSRDSETHLSATARIRALRCPILRCVAVLVPAIIALLPAGPQVALASVGHAAALPARGFIQDPSGSTILSPHYYFPQPVTVLTGMNVTFSVRSSVPVDVYLMASSQFSEFESTGSVSSVYGAEGTVVDGNVGPLSGGTYYLVIYNDLSSQDASVTYSASTLPVDVYEYYSSLPAPVGIADYGVLNASGALRPYRIVYEGAIGTATIYSLGAYNPSPPSGISPYGASLQLNVVMAVNTTHGDYAYWLQDVLGFLTNNGTMYASSNVWNVTSSPSSLSNSTVIGSGAVYTSPAGTYYGYETGAFSYSLPLNVKLLITVSRSSYGASASFGYSVDGGPVVWYDNVTVRSPGVTSAHLLVDGYYMTPSGHFYDSELVFGGEGNGEQTNFTRMKSTLFMEYVLPNGSRVSPPALYGFGSNTAETADDLSATLINGYPAVVIGPGNFGPLWYSAAVPQFGAAISAHASTVDAGMSVPVSLDSSTSNGVAPYTYYFYLNGTLAYNFTTYSPQYSGTVELPPTAAGHYALKVVVVDAVGGSASSSIIQV
ncbi:MAG: thermopsin family protease, partial [Conexivisphaera sp.]